MAIAGTLRKRTSVWTPVPLHCARIDAGVRRYQVEDSCNPVLDRLCPKGGAVVFLCVRLVPVLEAVGDRCGMTWISLTGNANPLR